MKCPMFMQCYDVFRGTQDFVKAITPMNNG